MLQEQTDHLDVTSMPSKLKGCPFSCTCTERQQESRLLGLHAGFSSTFMVLGALYLLGGEDGLQNTTHARKNVECVKLCHIRIYFWQMVYDAFRMSGAA